jgi:hypothetical protein
MRNLWCLEKISILPLIISATGIVPQSLFKNLKILNLRNTLVVEIQNSYLYHKAGKCYFASATTVCGAEAPAEAAVVRANAKHFL